jgi:cobalt/nickel transport protein
MRKSAVFIVAGLVVAFSLAIFASPFASSHPDGLESSVLKSSCDSAADKDACLADKEGESRWGGAPLPDYGGDAGPARAGLIGVAATFLVGYGLVVLVRARRERDAENRDAEDRDATPPRDRVG